MSDISELASAMNEAIASRDLVAVPAEKVEQVQNYFERDTLGGEMSAEERQAMLARNGLAEEVAPAAPAPAPVQVAPVAAPVLPVPAPAAPVGPTPEQLANAAQTRAIIEALAAIKNDLVESRKPPAKRREDMSELEGLRYDLVQEARAGLEQEQATLKAELAALKQAKIDSDRAAYENRAAHDFQNMARSQVAAVIHRPELVDPSLRTAQDAEDATELVLTAAAGWRLPADQAAAKINALVAREVALREQTRIMRTQPQVQRTAALPTPVAAGQPATGMPRRVPTNQDIAKAGYRDRWEASRDNYRRVSG